MHRVRIRLRELLMLVAIAALFLRPAVWVWEEWRNWRVHAEWAGKPKSSRPRVYELPPKSADNPFRP